MVWFHGGGFYLGWAGEPLFDGQELARRGVVLVSPNCRVGSLGYVAHPLLTAESPRAASGNYGLMDLVAALQWIRENIAAFGGDPGRITIFGQSSGAGSVTSLMSSPLARGLFHRAIAQSGGVNARMRLRSKANGPLESMESMGERLARRLGADTRPDVLGAMRAAPWKEVVDAWEDVLREGGTGMGLPNGGTINHLSVDGYVLPDAPGTTWREGRQHAVPFMTGSVAAEGFTFARNNAVTTLDKYGPFLERRFGADAAAARALYPADDDRAAFQAAQDVLGDEFVRAVRKAARRMAEVQPDTYLYQFRYVAAPDVARGVPASHGSELAYLFHRLPASAGYDDRDRAFSEQLIGYWTRFAATGDPNADGAPAWPRFDEASERHLWLDAPFEAGDHLRQEPLDFLDGRRRGG
jgi:para-nitrobenzyl esterase